MKPIRRGVPAGWALAALVFSAAAPGPALAQPATKAGWWVRVDTGKTEATGIGFQLGASAGERQEWRVWRTNGPAEFDLPADFSQRAALYLHATAIPDDEDVWFCVFYKGEGVRRFDFDTTEGATLKQTDRDPACR